MVFGNVKRRFLALEIQAQAIRVQSIQLAQARIHLGSTSDNTREAFNALRNTALSLRSILATSRISTIRVPSSSKDIAEHAQRKRARTHTQNTSSFLEHNTMQCNAVKRDHTYQHALLALSRLHLCLQALHEHCQSTQLRWTQPAQHHRDVQDLLFAARRPCLAVRLCGAFADA